jgi:L,D-transpeptidase catalytic domain
VPILIYFRLMITFLGRLLILGMFAFAVPAATAAADTPASVTTTATTTTTTSPTATSSTTTSTTTTSSSTSAPPPPPKAGKLRLYLPDVFFVRGAAVTIPNRMTHADGVITPYVPGQLVNVRVVLGHRVVKTQGLRVWPSRSHTYGRFTVWFKSPGTGILSVFASHARTSEQVGFGSGRGIRILRPSAGFGSRGTFVALIQQRLAFLHFYLRRSGVYDAGTGLALDAYHRLLHWGHYQSLDGRTVSFLLNGWGEFKVRFPRHGKHAEGNLGLQLLALVRGAKVQLIFPISSGKPSTPTILGSFHVYQRTPGYLPDGMYYSSFFIGGYAIHGYDPAPDYPASHGCMRLPIADAITAYNWLDYGDGVDVYY